MTIPMKTILPLIAILLASCASKIEAPPRAFPAPIQSADVAPMARVVKEDASRTAAASAKLESKVAELQRSSADLRAGVGQATAEADRLRKQKAASEKELDALWQMLTGSETRAKELFAEVEKAKSYADEQMQARLLAERRVDDLIQAASGSDVEKAELRAQRDHLASELEKAGKTHAMMQSALRDAERKGAIGTFFKGLLWWVGIAAVVLAIVWMALKRLKFL